MPGHRLRRSRLSKQSSTRPYDETAQVDFPAHSQNTCSEGLIENNKGQSENDGSVGRI